MTDRKQISRRSALILSGAALTGCATAGGSVAPSVGSVASPSSFKNYLFPLGVASGDPVADGFVLWTRLAPEPLTPDGGIKGDVEVLWEVSEDENFTSPVKRGRTVASDDWGHSVHAEVMGLKPNRPYFYRFIAEGQDSPVGRAITAPVLRSQVDRLRLAFASCQHFEQGFFTAYGDMVEQNPDLILQMGDYIYESSWGPQVRRHPVAEAVSLEDYRLMHAAYKMDASLQRAHAAAPFLYIWDDHEVMNDYAAEYPEDGGDPQEFLKRRRAAYQAFYEHQPLRRRSRPVGDHMRMYGYYSWGNLATLALIDGRQYRSDQACQIEGDWGGRATWCPELFDETRTYFGAEQERNLYPSFARNGAIWEVLAQPTLFGRLFQPMEDGSWTGHWTDGWDGYSLTRKALIDMVAQRRPKNFVSLGGDMHSWWQADVKADYNDPASETLGTEFVCTSVTSHSYAYNMFNSFLPQNPHIHFFDDRKRGYGMCEFTPDQLTVDFREVESVYTQTSKAYSRIKYVVENGKPGALEA